METGTSFILHRSAIALLFKSLALVIPVSIAYWVSVYLLSSNNNPTFSSFLNLLTSGYRIFCLVLVLEVIRLYFNDLYILDDRNIIHAGGRLSFHTTRTSINYEDIRDADITQGIMGRIFNYGTVTFGTASAEGHEVEFKDLPYPNEVARHVREYIKQLQKNANSTSTDYGNGSSNE